MQQANAQGLKREAAIGWAMRGKSCWRFACGVPIVAATRLVRSVLEMSAAAFAQSRSERAAHWQREQDDGYHIPRERRMATQAGCRRAPVSEVWGDHDGSGSRGRRGLSLHLVRVLRERLRRAMAGPDGGPRRVRPTQRLTISAWLVWRAKAGGPPQADAAVSNARKRARSGVCFGRIASNRSCGMEVNRDRRRRWSCGGPVRSRGVVMHTPAFLR